MSVFKTKLIFCFFVRNVKKKMKVKLSIENLFFHVSFPSKMKSGLKSLRNSCDLLRNSFDFE